MIDPKLVGALERARELGFLGPGAVTSHVAHADGFAEVIEGAHGIPRVLLDLGSGGGVPGLILAARWPRTKLTLLDAKARRCEFLRTVVAGLGWADRVIVCEARAEAAAHEHGLREQFDVVTARGFAPPAATAEIAAGFVAVGGILVVSEPPHGTEHRWDTEGLAQLGLEATQLIERPGGHFVILAKAHATPTTFPRAIGRPGKRPLF